MLNLHPMSLQRSQLSSDKPYKPFDTFHKAVLLYQEFEQIAFLLKEKGYTLLSHERLSNELGPLLTADAVFKVKVKCADGSIVEMVVVFEYQYTNDPDMVDRVFDYRQAIVKIHRVERVLPMVVYSGEHKCSMNLEIDDPLEIFRAKVPFMDITQMESDKFTTNPAIGVQFMAIFNHEIDPDVQAQMMFDGLQVIYTELGFVEMNRWHNMFISITNTKNVNGMMKLDEMMTIFPDLVIDNRAGLEILLEEKYKVQVEDAKADAKSEGIEIGKSEGIEIGKSEGIEIGKSEGIVEGRIESAYLMMKNAGMSFEAVSAALQLSEIEQVMLRRRMAQNGH
jgi:hypothetical protein